MMMMLFLPQQLLFISILNLAISLNSSVASPPQQNCHVTQCSIAKQGQAGEKSAHRIKIMHSAVKQSHLVHLERLGSISSQIIKVKT
jgi:hypothetical protein